MSDTRSGVPKALGVQGSEVIILNYQASKSLINRSSSRAPYLPYLGTPLVTQLAFLSVTTFIIFELYKTYIIQLRIDSYQYDWKYHFVHND